MIQDGRYRVGERTFSLETVGQEGNPHTLGWEGSVKMGTADP